MLKGDPTKYIPGQENISINMDIASSRYNLCEKR